MSETKTRNKRNRIQWAYRCAVRDGIRRFAEKLALSASTKDTTAWLAQERDRIADCIVDALKEEAIERWLSVLWHDRPNRRL